MNLVQNNGNFSNATCILDHLVVSLNWTAALETLYLFLILVGL